jgi:hypothetical protein
MPSDRMAGELSRYQLRQSLENTGLTRNHHQKEEEVPESIYKLVGELSRLQLQQGLRNSKEARTKFQDKYGLTECPICYEEQPKRRMYITTKCRHFYCRNCIVTHLSYDDKCPMCRMVILEKRYSHRLGNRRIMLIESYHLSNFIIE